MISRRMAEIDRLLGYSAELQRRSHLLQEQAHTATRRLARLLETSHTPIDDTHVDDRWPSHRLAGVVTSTSSSPEATQYDPPL